MDSVRKNTLALILGVLGLTTARACSASGIVGAQLVIAKIRVGESLQIDARRCGDYFFLIDLRMLKTPTVRTGFRPEIMKEVSKNITFLYAKFQTVRDESKKVPTVELVFHGGVIHGGMVRKGDTLWLHTRTDDVKNIIVRINSRDLAKSLPCIPPAPQG